MTFPSNPLTILKKNVTHGSLTVSKRVLDLSKRDLSQLLKKLPPFTRSQVTFPMRGKGNPTLYPSSWRRVPVRIDKTLAVGFDDLQFIVTDGGGKVSTAHDPTFDPANPHILLLAGARTGTFKLIALAPVPDNNPKVLGQLTFVVDGRRSDATGDGPPVWISGTVKSSVSGQASWGDGSDTGQTGQAYPEVEPALGIKWVLTLIVDTASDRFPAAEAATLRTALKDALTEGAADTL